MKGVDFRRIGRREAFYFSLLLWVYFALIGCQPIYSSNGSVYRQLAPAKEPRSNSLDSTRLVLQSFNLSNFVNQVSRNGDRHLVERVTGTDIVKLMENGKTLDVYFFNPGCITDHAKIKLIDSLVQKGQPILAISISNDFPRLEKLLSRTSLSRWPYYVSSVQPNTRILIKRQSHFIKEACPTCYDKFKDDLFYIDHLRIDNGSLNVVW